jgi:hypothetical protein
MEWNYLRTKEFNPIYVLYDLVLNKPIGYYALTEADQIDLDSENYISAHPGYSMRDLGLQFDRWGLTLPKIGVDEFL